MGQRRIYSFPQDDMVAICKIREEAKIQTVECYV